MAESLIELRNLQLMRGRSTVLTVEQLSIYERDVLAVVGPNGAGKSTLLLALARLLYPSAGEIRFRGKLVDDESDLTYRRRIAMVLQDPLLFDMSVFDNVASGLRFRGVPRREIGVLVEPWLERLGIAALRDRRAVALSGGEAQRVSLARAFVLEPDLLLLDEPFAALDPPTRRRLVVELSSLLAETKTTTVIVTHDLEEATHMGNRIAVVLQNRLRAVGLPAELLAGSDDPEILAFTQSSLQSLNSVKVE